MLSKEYATLLGVINIMYADMGIDESNRYTPSEFDVVDTFNTISDEYIMFMQSSKHNKKANQNFAWIRKIVKWVQDNRL